MVVTSTVKKQFEMYIEYITPQRVADSNFTEYHSSGGDFRPTWLIRTSDWEKVRGHEAINGYHTLSYCWEQSGEKFQADSGEYALHDDGLHRITTITANERVASSSKSHPGPKALVTRHATYNELLQQICKDFDIEYLWYDKICIDQTNKEEKKREIKQMHRIYSNARYTIALVPEIYIDNPKEFDTRHHIFQITDAKKRAWIQMKHSLWWKRSWTLEEVMMSTHILVVGRNSYFWSLARHKHGKTVMENDLLSNIMLGFHEKKLKSANQVLTYAHFRTSTKKHDKIFALANIFHDVISIDIDYSSDFRTVMNSFYRQLAQRDLSLLCFGANTSEGTGAPLVATTMSSYNLPSWTGVTGIHSTRPVVDIALGENGSYSIDDGMDLHIRCRSYTVRPIQYDDHVLLDRNREVRAGKYSQRVINSMDDFDGDETAARDWSQVCMLKASINYTHYAIGDAACCSPVLPLSLTESCDECVVLGVLIANVTERLLGNGMFGYIYNYLSPVVVKMSSASPVYKVIGVILLKHFQCDEPRKSPQEFLNEIFEQLGPSEYQDFCIK